MLVYLLRSIKARWLENLAIVAVYFVVVTTGILIVSFAANMRDTALAGGDARTVIVLSSGASSLIPSRISKEASDSVRVRPEIEQGAGTTLVSPEMFITAQMRTTWGLAMTVGVRGVDPVALLVHDKVRIAKGRAPQPGSDEIMIGKAIDGVFPGFSLGGQWHGHPIVGLFEAQGSTLEHELWVDRQQLILELGRRATDPIGFLVVKAKSSGDAAALIDYIRNSKQSMSAFSEPEWLKNTSGDSEALLRLAVGFSLLLALGAGIASVNTLYSSLLGRLPEFAALHAIGVRRRGLAGLILQESLLLALVGIAAAIGVSMALNGQYVSRLWTDHPFEQLPLNVGLRSIGLGVGIGLAVSLAGGLLTGFSIFRVDMGKYR